MTDLAAFVAAFNALPVGTFRGDYNGRSYIVSRTSHDGCGWNGSVTATDLDDVITSSALHDVCC